MTARTSRRLLIPALSTVAIVLIASALGVWQLERRAWKRGLLDQFEAAERNPPVPLGPDLPPFAKISVSGRLRLDRAAFYGAEVRDGVLGAQLIVPLERAGAAPVLVDLGWVPDGAPAPWSQPDGAAVVQGYLRPGERPGWFAAPDNPAKRRFYTLDPAVIASAVGEPEAAPFVVVALGGPPPPGAPGPARHLPTLPNNHLQYAITWFSLAATAAGVFAVYAAKGGRA